ncbi:HPP family protein [Shewanella sp. FJAT-52076]|uniref:HPP family protein n=1 Tax=Shewanella sp. FJAT-52076 TaxID=2864202 RepID=UPI001C65EFD3|nr:HPP family protein [Shewanella sp. FJAT-52076]QYJ75598.1 HPP family protein [Shewanella sp. FJAT-52076]
MRKLKGGGALPARATPKQLIKGLAGGFFGVLLLGLLGQTTGATWLMAPFGATCVILFAAPGSPLAQPRNVIGGHLIAATIGLAALYGLGDSLWVMALAVGLSILVMQVFRAVHPPAGANPLVIIFAGQAVVGFDFLLYPVLLGSVALVAIAALLNNIAEETSWPNYWHGIGRNERE